MRDAQRSGTKRRVDAAVHEQALSRVKARAEIPDLVEPDELEMRRTVVQHDLEQRPARAPDPQLAHARPRRPFRLHADRELAHRVTPRSS